MDDSKLCFEKNILSLQKFNASIDPLNKSFSKKLQFLEKKIKAINPPRIHRYLEKVSVPKVTLVSGNVYNCYIENVL